MKHLPILGLYLFGLLPLLMAAGFCFFYSMQSPIHPGQWTISYWFELLTDRVFYRTLWYSLQIAFGTIFLTVVLSVIIGFQIYRGTTSASLWQIGLIFPPIIAALLAYQWLNQSGWFSRMGTMVGLWKEPTEFPIMVYSTSAFPLLLIHTLLLVPFFSLFLHLQYEDIKYEKLKEIQMQFHISRVTFWRKAVLPLMWRRIRSIAILYLILVMGAYEIPLLIGASAPRMWTIYIVDYLHKFNMEDIPKAYAAATVFFIVASLSIYFFRKIISQNQLTRL